MDVDYHFVHESVAQKLLNIRFVHTGDQVADGFTKPLSMRQLMAFRQNLNLDRGFDWGLLKQYLYLPNRWII